MKELNKIEFIAEAGINHNGSIKKAFKMIDLAASAKADIIKFQFTNPNLISKHAKKAEYQIQKNDISKSQKKMIELIDLDWKTVIPKLIKRCKQKKIKFLISVFDISDFKKIEKFKPKIIKIPSGEIDNIPFLEYLAKKNLKTILSTGMSTLPEIDSAIKTLLKNGLKKKNLVLMQCTSAYPTPFEEANLKVLEYYKIKYNLSVGLSDHTPGIISPIVSVGFGVRLIEKHFTLSKKMKGPDHKASLDPKELKNLVTSLRIAEKLLGSDKKKITKGEKKNKTLSRKSIFAINNIQVGEKFNLNNIGLKRPAIGLKPKKFNSLIGKKSKFRFRKDQVIKI
tara:strand:- start:41 stop:1054 length:1014 start_codon:yes stop_codon:yes gene_type:complete